MSPLPPGPVPAPAPLDLGGAGAGSSSDLPPPSYEEFLRIASQAAGNTGGGSHSADNQRQQRQLTAAASAIVVASGGSNLYPTLTSSNYHGNYLNQQAQAQAQAGTGAGVGDVISDVSSIGSDSCGHVQLRQSAAAALMKTSVEPNLPVGIDGRIATAGGGANNDNLHWTTTTSPLFKHDEYPLHGIHNIHGSPLDASSGAASAGNKSAKSAKSKSSKSTSGGSSMLIIRAAEPYVRPPPQPAAFSSSSSATGGDGGSQASAQGSAQGSVVSSGSSVVRKPRATATSNAEAAAGMEPSESTGAVAEDNEAREVQRQLQRQIKASRAAAALLAARQPHPPGQGQGQGLQPASEPEPQLQQGTISSGSNKAERRLSIPKAEVGASSRDTIRCHVPPSTATATAQGTSNDRHHRHHQQQQQQRRLSLTEVRKYLDSDSEPEAEAEVKRLTDEFKAKFEVSTSTLPRTSSTAMINADGVPTSVLARRHTYTVGSTPASSSSYCYNGVGVSPNTTLHTSITTLDDPFGNQRRRASMSRLHLLGSPSYEASHPRGRLSVTDTRFLLFDPTSDEDDDGDDADDERDHGSGSGSGSGSSSKIESSRAGRRHKHIPTSFRRRSSSASAKALAALVPSASPTFPTGSVGGTSDDGSENLQERHPSFANRRKAKCGNKTVVTPKKESAEPSTHSAEYFAAPCHDDEYQGVAADHGAAVRTGLSKSDPGLRLPLNAMEVGFLPLNDTTDSKKPTVVHRATSLVNVLAKSDAAETAEYDLSASGKRYPRSSSIDLLRSRLSAAPSTDAADILSRVPQRTSILTVRTMEESIGQSGEVCREMGRLRRMSRLGSYHGSMEGGDEVNLDAAAKEGGGATDGRRRSSTISFNEVEVRSYPITAGDHPCVSSGPPLTLQWDAVDQRKIDLDDYESTRPQYRSREQMYMPAKVRVEALQSEGHARSAIKKSAEKAKEGKEQRKQTRRKSGVISVAEHALELSKRGLKNMVHRKKKDEEKNFLKAAKAADAQSKKERDDYFAKEAEAIDALAETEDLRGFIVSIDGRWK